MLGFWVVMAAGGPRRLLGAVFTRRCGEPDWPQLDWTDWCCYWANPDGETQPTEAGDRLLPLGCGCWEVFLSCVVPVVCAGLQKLELFNKPNIISPTLISCQASSPPSAQSNYLCADFRSFYKTE